MDIQEKCCQKEIVHNINIMTDNNKLEIILNCKTHFNS